MIRNIIELYGLGAIPISRVFGEMIEPPREIIDVEYEDITNQVDSQALISQNEFKLLEPNKQKQYADTDNK